MIKPKHLKKGDKIAVVSLSWGGAGDPQLIHKYNIGKKRLETEFGLEVIAMPNALKGTEFVSNHPELRAQDLMDAFKDPTINAIFCSIGGDDSIRLLPYIDYEIIKNNPKIFMGYSDTTINHFMMYKAGLVSFYGPSVMAEFGEYVKMPDYTIDAVKSILFGNSTGYEIISSPIWSSDFISWDEAHQNIQKKFIPDTHGYEILQGKGKVQGHFLGGCIDVFMMAVGTEIFPSLEKWKNAILFIETSEEKPSPQIVIYALRNLAAQKILSVISAIVIGKPCQESFYNEYKEAIVQVVNKEENLKDIPIIYNVNFGHACPIGVIPYGIQAEIDCDKKKITLLESCCLY